MRKLVVAIREANQVSGFFSDFKQIRQIFRVQKTNFEKLIPRF